MILGDHRINAMDSTEQTFYIEEVHNHASFNDYTNVNDITLLKLSANVTFNNYIQPACLPTEDGPAGTLTWVTGWGDQEGNIVEEYLFVDFCSLSCSLKSYFYLLLLVLLFVRIY